MRGFVISSYFLKALSQVFDVDNENIDLIGDDDLENIEIFKRTPKADLQINLKNGEKIRIEVQSGFEACSRGKKVKFYTTAGLVNRLIEAKKENELERFMKKLSKIDLLICDEWGYIPFEKEGSQLLFQVISECYERKSVIITTNPEFGKWNGIFYDEKLTSALIDRLIHHSHLLVFSGASYRLKNSRMRTD